MCGKVLNKELILWDLGVYRITVTAVLRTEHEDRGDGGFALVAVVEMAKCPFCIFLK